MAVAVFVCAPNARATQLAPLVDLRFRNLLPTPGDVAAISMASFLNSRSFVVPLSVLLLLVFVLGAHGWYLENKTRRKIASLAYVEQRRARILEEINQSKPLAGILEKITELASVRLNGAACWCQVVEGAMLGNRPARLSASSLRTVEFPIPSRSGVPLGSLFAAFDARTWPSPAEQEALAMAASLATLAIETSRLLADLVYRSEFDLLTDVQNRFVLEKRLKAMIEAARQSASVFGLIFIDLDDFKNVNDAYGHMVGDRYLQEVARRMKYQLRASDTLARLGGDEFAVLLPEVRTREGVEEIASRLESCFEEPILIEEHELRGTASLGIALYPEDGDSIDGLLSAADSAMYACKHTRQGAEWAMEVVDAAAVEKMTERK
ncbi:MAG: diguanylate cyclase domain-containing protein [Terracidiphilus sp.]